MAAAPERVKKPTGKTTHVYDLAEVEDYLIKRYRMGLADFIPLRQFMWGQNSMPDDREIFVVDMEKAIMKMENANAVGALYKDYKEAVMVFRVKRSSE